MSLVKAAASGVSWTAGATMLRAGLQVAQIIVVARFLSAAELGLLAMLNLLIGFAQIFADAGLSNAVIFHKQLNRKQLDKLYILNILLGLTLTLLMLALAIPLEQFFAIDGLAVLLWMLSPVFVIRSLTQQPMAILQQQMKFKALAGVETIAALLAFVVLLAGLYLGWQANAIVYSQIVAAVTLSGLLLIICKPSVPRWQGKGWQDVIEPVRYGLYQTGEACINYLSAQFDQLLIGKLMNADVLGVYAYVKALVFRPALQLINPVVHKVTFPLMANCRDDRPLEPIYWQILKILGLLNVPLYLTLACYPAAILGLVFGESWVQHAELLRYMALLMLLISLINPIGSLLRATGEVKRGFWWNVMVTTVRPAVILVSYPHGLMVMVQALLGLQVILFFGHWWFLIRPTIGMTLLRLLGAQWQPIAAFALGWGLMQALQSAIGDLGAWWQISFIALVYCAVLALVLRQMYLSVRKS